MAIDYLKARDGSNIPLWIPVNEVESTALDQVRNVAELPWVKRLAVMPDVHAGMGATIGTVIGMKDAVSPSTVGVDIGCVDCKTEYLTPTGWCRIDQYDGGPIMEYAVDSGKAFFQEPKKYIRLPCDTFYRIKTKYGVNQKLSAEHRVLYARYDRAYKFNITQTILATDLVEQHNAAKIGFRGRFITTFIPELTTRVDMSDEDLRIAVMIAADGSICNLNTGNCRFTFKKPRKIERSRQLLTDADIKFTESTWKDTVSIRFTAPLPPGGYANAKTLATFWPASLNQLRVIVSEVFHWDGNLKDHCYYTRDKASADFISYAIAATGYRSVTRNDTHYKDGKLDYRVFAYANTKVGIYDTPKTPIEIVSSVDGYKYCFTTNTGYWIMRRGGNIAVTGNCGMGAVKTNLNAAKVMRKRPALRAAIETRIPVSFNGHARPAFENAPTELRLEAEALFARFGALAPEVKDHIDRAKSQLGTLGGGNHFIEMNLDADKNIWLMLHSGSRWIGKELADVHIRKAITLRHNVGLPDKALAVFLNDTPEMAAYLHDLVWAQHYAALNRKLMLWLYQEAIRKFWSGLQLTSDEIWCTHNYVEIEEHDDDILFVTRKGAIRAREGDMGIIPGSIGARSYIVRGRGCAESLMSAPHGAGRKMSRSKAKKKFTLADVEEQTKGVECKKDKSILDELREAYKPIKRVMDNSDELVEIVTELQPAMLCVKG